MRRVNADTHAGHFRAIGSTNGSGASPSVSLIVLRLESTASDFVAPTLELPGKADHFEFDDETGRIWTNRHLAQVLDQISTPSKEIDVPFDFDPDDYPVY